MSSKARRHCLLETDFHCESVDNLMLVFLGLKTTSQDLWFISYSAHVSVLATQLELSSSIIPKEANKLKEGLMFQKQKEQMFQSGSIEKNRQTNKKTDKRNFLSFDRQLPF